MLSLSNTSPKELLKFLREEQKTCIIKNREQIKDYYVKNSLEDSIENYKYEHEWEIIFMIKHFISLKFIKKYFNISTDYVKKIAIKNKCHSQLLSDFTENEEARCFSKSQILRSCEDFNYICPMCFKSLDITNTNTLTGHHIQPFARGGKTTKDNCLPLHLNCHFDDFKLLHSVLFDSTDPIYSAKYFDSLKNKLKKEKSGIDAIIKREKSKIIDA